MNKTQDHKLITLLDHQDHLNQLLEKQTRRVLQATTRLIALRRQAARLRRSIRNREREIAADRRSASAALRKQRLEDVRNEGLPPRPSEPDNVGEARTEWGMDG